MSSKVELGIEKITTKPLDLSIKPKMSEVDRSLCLKEEDPCSTKEDPCSPKEDPLSPTNEIPSPPVGVIKFCPKIVSSNSVPPIGVSMIDRNQVSSNHVLKPSISLDPLYFRSPSDVGEITSWPTLYSTVLPYPVPLRPLSGTPTDFVNASSVQAHHDSLERGGFLGGVAISEAPTLIPMSAPRIQIPACFSPDANTFYDKSSQRLNQMELLKENSSYNNMWTSKKDSMSRISRPDSCESNKDLHIQTHERPCKCTICGKEFSQPWILQGHIRTHTGEKPFSCPHCNRSFADRSNLRAHIQLHSYDKYSCSACSKTFSKMSLLVKHNKGGCGA